MVVYSMRLFTNRIVKFTNKLVKLVFTKQVSKLLIYLVKSTNLGFQCAKARLLGCTEAQSRAI